MSDRYNYLSVTELPILRAWGWEVSLMFGAMPYQVGSSLQHKDYRDVDIRVMLDDERYNDLAATGVDLYYLNLSVSLWGQKVTSLPIDFQVQRITEANSDYNFPRNPCGINPKAFQQTRKDANEIA